jgi:hypothetical protein
MYCKIIEKVCRKLENTWIIYSLKKKMVGKLNGRGARSVRTLGWSMDFPRVCGKPLQNIRYLKVLFYDP